MEERRFYWLKLRADFFDSKPIMKLRSMPGGDTYTIIFQKLLLLSLNTCGLIEFEGIDKTPYEEISLVINEDPEAVAIVINLCSKWGLIETREGGDIFMNSVPSLVGSESAVAERVRRHRTRQKEADKLLQCNADVTSGKRLRNVDIDIDIEKEIEKEIEKDAPRPTTKKFQRPSVDEIRQYCLERQSGINPEHFFDYYESKGWMIGKNHMKDWKAAVRTWEQRRKEEQPARPVPDWEGQINC